MVDSRLRYGKEQQHNETMVCRFGLLHKLLRNLGECLCSATERGGAKALVSTACNKVGRGVADWQWAVGRDGVWRRGGRASAT